MNTEKTARYSYLRDYEDSVVIRSDKNANPKTLTFKYMKHGDGFGFPYIPGEHYLVSDADGSVNTGDYFAYCVIECGPVDNDTAEITVDATRHDIREDCIEKCIERGWCDEEDLVQD
jgi:hypothetical protein